MADPAEAGGDTAFRLRTELPKRRGASLPAAVQTVWLRLGVLALNSDAAFRFLPSAFETNGSTGGGLEVDCVGPRQRSRDWSQILSVAHRNLSIVRTSSTSAHQMDAGPRLFKYLSSDKLVFFENHLVLLTPPIYLNDPWDFLPKGRNPTEEEILKVWRDVEMENAKASVIHLPTEFWHRQSMERLQKARDRANSKEFAEGLSKYSRERISSEYGIVSLTEKPLCRLMWAHYAESHAGFVAEFATHDQFKHEDLSACGCDIGPVRYAAKVDYPKSFKFRPWTAETIAIDCFSKHPEWEYEQEWRIVWPLKQSFPYEVKSSNCGKTFKRYCLPFEPANLRRVIFGMRMNSEVQKRLRIMLDKDAFKDVQRQTTDIDSKTGELILKPLP